MQLLRLLCLTTLLTLGIPAPAAPHHDAAHGHAHEWAEAFGGVSLPEVWQRLRTAEAVIETSLAQRSLAGLADAAETIHLAAHALVDQVRLPDAARQIRLAAALHQAAALADEVQHHATNANPDHTTAAFRRLQSALNLARLRLPTTVTGE